MELLLLQLACLLAGCSRGLEEVVPWPNELALVVIETKNCGAAEEGVVHVNVAGIVVGVRVPETSLNHTYYDE